MSKQHSTLLPQTATVSNDSIVKISSFRQSRNKLNMFNLFRLYRKDEISFDIVAETGNIVAKNGNNVEATLDIVERIVQLVAFDNIAWALLLVWTGFNWNRVLPGPNGYKIPNAFLLVCLLVRRFKLSKLWQSLWSTPSSAFLTALSPCDRRYQHYDHCQSCSLWSASMSRGEQPQREPVTRLSGPQDPQAPATLQMSPTLLSVLSLSLRLRNVPP